VGRGIVQRVRLIPKEDVHFEFLQYLDAMGVRHAVLHGWESLALGPVSDVDIVVAAKDLQRLEAGLCARYRILMMFHYEASSFGFALARQGGASASPFIADFTTDYRWRGRIFFSGDELLQDRRKWKGIWVVGPGDEFAYLLVKRIYEKGQIPEPQKRRIEELAHGLGPEAREMAQRLFGDKAGGQLIDWILAKEWNDVEGAIPRLQRRLRWQTMKRDPLNPLRYWIPELWRRGQRWRYPTGVSVAVIGPEGEKKSTLLCLLKEMLPTAFRRVAVLHQEPAPIDRLYRRLASKLRFIWHVRPLLVRSTLVLLDWDEEQVLGNLSNGDKAASDSVARHIAPEPDLLIVMGSSLESLREIKNTAFWQEAKKSLPALPSERPRIFLLDGRLPAEEMARHASCVLSDYLGERYLKRRNIWFSCQVTRAMTERQMLGYRELL
jgi:hypothetical protein